MRIRVAWTAARDGIGHAVIGRAFNAVCGRRATLERLSWPVTQRCLACQAKLTEAVPIAV